MKKLEEKRNQLKIKDCEKARIVASAKEKDIIKLQEEIGQAVEHINLLVKDSENEGIMKKKIAKKYKNCNNEKFSKNKNENFSLIFPQKSTISFNNDH